MNLQVLADELLSRGVYASVEGDTLLVVQNKEEDPSDSPWEIVVLVGPSCRLRAFEEGWELRWQNLPDQGQYPKTEHVPDLDVAKSHLEQVYFAS